MTQTTLPIPLTESVIAQAPAPRAKEKVRETLSLYALLAPTFGRTEHGVQRKLAHLRDDGAAHGHRIVLLGLGPEALDGPVLRHALGRVDADEPHRLLGPADVDHHGVAVDGTHGDRRPWRGAGGLPAAAGDDEFLQHLLERAAILVK